MKRLPLLILLSCGILSATVALNSFHSWGSPLQKEPDAYTLWMFKRGIYMGWRNGFFAATAGNATGASFATCVHEIPEEQAFAMIDKFYADHPEKWTEPLRNC